MEPFGPVPTDVADVLIPTLLDTWASASMAGQTDAVVQTGKELEHLLRAPAMTHDEYQQRMAA